MITYDLITNINANITNILHYLSISIVSLFIIDF
jgi:hypothetical protein